jgi:YVTN family beta-propeller protein
LSFLYVCNTSSDYISKINLGVFKEESRISLNLNKLTRVGPHDLYPYKDKLLVANSHNNNLSIVSRVEDKEVESYFIGMHCNGVRVFNDNAYIICGELNSLIVFNLIKNKIVEEIPCENFPHSISIHKHKGKLVVSNMNSDSITLIDINDKENAVNIKVGAYPTRAVFTPDGRYIIVCESNMGVGQNGAVSIIHGKTLKIINRIPVGNCPVDIYSEDEKCYVSNFGEGTISIVDIIKGTEIKKAKIGGMPRGIIKIGKHIYIGDNYNNLLIEYDMEKENKKAILIGNEPTGMTLY